MTDVALTARLDPAWNSAQVDLASASEMDLRYRSLLGDVELRIGDSDFSTKWGWIPLLDFALGLTDLLMRLPDSRFESFEFTESGAELRFEMRDREVEIRSNFTAAIGHAPLDVLRRAALGLAEQVLSAARTEAPGIDANPDFERLVRGIRRSV